MLFLFVEVLLLRLVDLGVLTPELIVLAVLVALCGGMGTGPRWAAGVRGSIVLGLGSLDETEKIQTACQKEATTNILIQHAVNQQRAL